MKKYSRASFVLACLFVTGCFLLLGCSVKENRAECPCLLVLEFDKTDTLLTEPVNLIVAAEGEVLYADVVMPPYDSCVLKVPKDVMEVSVWHGDDDLSIPYGCECPSLYMHSFVADTRCERFVQKVDLHKNHCCLTILVEGCEKLPYSLTLHGNVDGYEIDGEPSDGEFSCVAYPEHDGEAVVRLPRQMDDSLILEVDDGSFVTRYFALGEYLAAGGYDWSEENLQDVTVILDYFLTYVRIVVQGWEQEHVYDVIL